eukprot:jgi/Mesen1/8230/ME000443S07376
MEISSVLLCRKSVGEDDRPESLAARCFIGCAPGHVLSEAVVTVQGEGVACYSTRTQKRTQVWPVGHGRQHLSSFAVWDALSQRYYASLSSLQGGAEVVSWPSGDSAPAGFTLAGSEGVHLSQPVHSLHPLQWPSSSRSKKTQPLSSGVAAETPESRGGVLALAQDGTLHLCATSGAAEQVTGPGEGVACDRSVEAVATCQLEAPAGPVRQANDAGASEPPPSGDSWSLAVVVAERSGGSRADATPGGAAAGRQSAAKKGLIGKGTGAEVAIVRRVLYLYDVSPPAVSKGAVEGAVEGEEARARVALVGRQELLEPPPGKERKLAGTAASATAAAAGGGDSRVLSLSLSSDGTVSVIWSSCVWEVLKPAAAQLQGGGRSRQVAYEPTVSLHLAAFQPPPPGRPSPSPSPLKTPKSSKKKRVAAADEAMTPLGASSQEQDSWPSLGLAAIPGTPYVALVGGRQGGEGAASYAQASKGGGLGALLGKAPQSAPLAVAVLDVTFGCVHAVQDLLEPSEAGAGAGTAAQQAPGGVVAAIWHGDESGRLLVATADAVLAVEIDAPPLSLAGVLGALSRPSLAAAPPRRGEAGGRPGTGAGRHGADNDGAASGGPGGGWAGLAHRAARAAQATLSPEALACLCTPPRLCVAAPDWPESSGAAGGSGGEAAGGEKEGGEGDGLSGAGRSAGGGEGAAGADGGLAGGAGVLGMGEGKGGAGVTRGGSLEESASVAADAGLTIGRGGGGGDGSSLVGAPWREEDADGMDSLEREIVRSLEADSAAGALTLEGFATLFRPYIARKGKRGLSAPGWAGMGSEEMEVDHEGAAGTREEAAEEEEEEEAGGKGDVLADNGEVPAGDGQAGGGKGKPAGSRKKRNGKRRFALPCSLLSPQLRAATAVACLRARLWQPLGAIIGSGQLSALACPGLVQALLAERQLLLVERSVMHIRDLPPSNLLLVLQFVLEPSNAPHLAPVVRNCKAVAVNAVDRVARLLARAKLAPAGKLPTKPGAAADAPRSLGAGKGLANGGSTAGRPSDDAGSPPESDVDEEQEQEQEREGEPGVSPSGSPASSPAKKKKKSGKAKKEAAAAAAAASPLESPVVRTAVAAAASVDGFSPAELFLHALVAPPRDEAVLTAILARLDGPEVTALVRYLCKWARLYWDRPTALALPRGSKPLLPMPPLAHVLAWACTLLDCHLLKLVLQAECREDLSRLQSMLGQQVKLASRLAPLAGILDHIEAKAPVPGAGAGAKGDDDYVVEYIDLD